MDEAKSNQFVAKTLADLGGALWGAPPDSAGQRTPAAAGLLNAPL
jgi:hypothetical protein